MKTIFDIILLSFVVIYIVDYSGFTQTWLSFLSAYKKKRIFELKPFSCSLCMVWWTGLAYLLIAGHFTLPMVGFVALLSFLSAPIGQFLVFMREGLNAVVNKLMDLL